MQPTFFLFPFSWEPGHPQKVCFLLCCFIPRVSQRSVSAKAGLPMPREAWAPGLGAKFTARQ
ncbi:hypothetical protein Cadr_000001529 [Camelus dromedarius]|uniref:Uncharacterized protein n=1 Tax=Camelus dromedarius TaxID=9838 RepID=A0A5N4EGK3_CAMDR|nr:hypothetical protein Cadr_000001529 [Camelus dromedarius]